MQTVTFQPIAPWLYCCRWLPQRLPGRGRLIRAILRLAAPTGPVEIRAGKLTFQAPSLQEPVAAHLLADGMYDPATCAAIQRVLSQDGTFLDVGANIGAMGLWAAATCCPQGRVFGFEASPRIFRYLAQNAERNGIANFTPLNRAVTAKDDDMLAFFDAPEAKFGMGSLANRFGGSGVEVPTTTLDGIAASHDLNRVEVIKVDVEGFELGVFQGSLRLLHQTPAPVIIFEFNDWAENRPEMGIAPGAAQKFLLEQGYRLQSVKAFLAGESAGTRVLTQGEQTS
jgi:FkbM family methyltransferase